MKTKDLIGPALDWAVTYARCFAATNGKPVLARDLANRALRNGLCPYSTDWAQGGPIIEREDIELRCWRGEDRNRWQAEMHPIDADGDWITFGDTPLVAAMRAFVASKLGDEVEIPKELS